MDRECFIFCFYGGILFRFFGIYCYNLLFVVLIKEVILCKFMVMILFSMNGGLVMFVLLISLGFLLWFMWFRWF